MTNPQRIGHDLAERKVVADVNEYGWHACNIIEDDGQPPWTFTIGLYETWRFPELIIVGRSRATAHEMLRAVVTEIENNRQPDYRDTQDLYLLLGMACCFIEVREHHYSDYVGLARWYYRAKHFPLYQLVWPAKGHHPWSLKATDAFKNWQPVLGHPPDH